MEATAVPTKARVTDGFSPHTPMQLQRIKATVH
jgi:hypothetical protein